MNITKCHITFFAIISTILLLSGCIEIWRDIPTPSIEVPKIITDIADKTKEYFSIGVSALTDNVSNLINVIDWNVERSIDGLDTYINGIAKDSKKILPENINLVKSIATLEPINDTSLTSINSYHDFADGVNTILKFINREGDVDSKLLKGTTEEYAEVSMFITRWFPLVNNYNNLIYTARAYDEDNPESVNEYYLALGQFGLELGLIYSHAWYKMSYTVVGKVYRISGLNRLAFKCPTLVSSVLSKAHWGLRNYLTDKTTETAGIIVMSLPNNIIDDISKRIPN